MSEDLHLPDECWELVMKFLIINHHRYLEPLSLVSKQFLSITNRLRFSLIISQPTLPFLPRLLLRFPSLTSLDLTRFRGDLHAPLRHISRSSLPLKSLNISHHPTIPANGLRALGKNVKSLNSLICSDVGSLRNADLILIADCFPFLEELDLSFPKDAGSNYPNSFDGPVSDFGVKILSLGLPKLRKINLSGNFFINDPSLISLCKNCKFLEEVVIFECHFITQAGIASAIGLRPCLCSLSVNNLGCGTKKGDLARPFVTSDFIDSLVRLKSLTCLDLSCSSITNELLIYIADEGLPLRKLVLQNCSNYSYRAIFRLFGRCQFVQHLDLQNAEYLNDQRVEELCLGFGNLISINVSGCRMLTDSALVALVRYCPLLDEIKMEATGVGRKGIEVSSMGVVVNSKVKSLHLARNSCLKDGSIEMFASICPNLQMLDLSSCRGISEGIVEVLRRCCGIRHLNLAFCSGVKLVGLNFEVPKLEELNLSLSRIDDEALSVISKCCQGLLHLHLENCSHVTAKGVRQVVEICTQLREINLRSCDKVDASVVAWMVFSRPSLRKIMAPPSYDRSESQKRFLLRHGCMVC
ncbi:F-box/LRR-repeat protein 4-like [Abrus precatorius]|uniref:F-box/LRR-repeat protein 4-like n=1 Tax=Abrus precatorius TaxID=3816 RepID=A0A8B8KM25_ABRPR|nr:F-box/LRR-repeat protein 4-like [Abrus precatorius]